MKLFATDMDGTLLNDQKIITKENFKFLREVKNKGYKIAVCTGRPLNGIVIHFEEDNLIDYYIANNGAVLYDVQNEKILFEDIISQENIKKLLDFSNSVGTDIQFITEDHIVNYNNKVGIYMSLDAYLVNMDIYFKTFSFTTEDKFLKALITGEKHLVSSLEGNIPRELQEIFSFTQSTENNIDITHKNVSKGRAIEKIKLIEDIRRENVVSIGDHKNDLSMFEVSGLSIAMQNAEKIVKETADLIGPDNNIGLSSLQRFL